MKVVHLYPQCPAAIAFWAMPEADDPGGGATKGNPMILEFADLDQFAEMIWALIARAAHAGREEVVSHAQWLAMSDEGKEAARAIARELAGIFGPKL